MATRADAPPGASDHPTPTPTPTRSRVGLAVALTLVALLPVVVAVVTRVGTDWVPVGDLALVDLRVRDVWSRAIPLVGTYNRFGWNHPGPAMFWLLAPLSALTGRSASATLVGGALLQGVAILAAAWLAWRKGGLALVAAVLALNGLAYGALGTALVLWPWNPSIAFPYFLVLVLLAWCVADGELVLLPFLVAVAALLVQTHVGYAPLAGAAVVFAVVWAAASSRRRRRAGAASSAAPGEAASHPWRGPLLWSVAVLVVAVAPVVVQEVVRRPNVERLLEFLVRSPGYPRLGFDFAAGVVADGFRIPPPWLGGHTTLDPFTNTVVPASRWWLMVPVVLLGLAVVAVRRPGARRLGVLVALSALLTVVGLGAVARVAGPAERYVFYWRIPLALMTVSVALGSAWYAFGLDRSVVARRAAFAGLAVVVVFSSTALAVRTAQTDDIVASESTARAALDALDARDARDRDGVRDRVLVRAPDTSYLGLQRAVVNELDRDATDVRVDDDLGFQFGESRTATPADVDEVLYVVEGGQYRSVLSDQPGARVLWSTDVLSAAKEQELTRLQRQLWGELQAAGRPDLFTALGSDVAAFALEAVPGIDQDAAKRVAQLNGEIARRGRCRCGIIAFSAADTPAVVLPR